jgi:hypothetical protein
MGGKAELPSGYPQKRDNFHLLSKAPGFCYRLLKVEGAVEIFLTPQRFTSTLLFPTIPLLEKT